MTSRVHLAYISARYPWVSHTFIQSEVEALRELGVTVDTISVRTVPAEEGRSAHDRHALATTRGLLPASRPAMARAALDMLRHPGATASMVRYGLARAGRSPKRALWQLFYAVEAVLLWRHCRALGVRHVHAHMANVACDVARLTCHFARRTGEADAEQWTWSFTMHGSAEFFSVRDHDLGGKVAAADLVVCISDFCRAQMMAWSGSEHWSKLHVVHCGIDPDRFALAERSGERRNRILCVGRLVAPKGQGLLLDTVAELRRRAIECELVLVGDGDDRAAFEAQAERLGIADRVEFTGSVGQDDIAELYADSDVFCLASFAEGVPVVLMEAMATGLPVVAPAIMGVPELVDDGVSGMLVPPGRVDLLADALAELLGDPERRATMGKAGREAVLDRFDRRASAAQLVELFDDLPGTRAR
jgi:colanic acid/amylovoran biosynthesis glycosyltransferase